jgi:hypothetical protein
MFLNVHVGSSSLSDDEVDQMHDQMLASEGHMFDEVLHGRVEATTKWSVLPSTTRSLPTSWMSEEQLETEILNYGLES